MDPDAVVAFLASWGYAAVLVLLVLTGVGSPIPEDLLLVTTGYLVFFGIFDWPLALVVGTAGIVSSDVLVYIAGRHIGWSTARDPDVRLLTPSRIDWATRGFRRVGNAWIFFARLLPGTRAVVFATAGLHGVPLERFLQLDTLGAMVWVPLMVWAGYALGHHVGEPRRVVEWLNAIEPAVVVTAGVLIAMWVGFGRQQSKL